MKCITTMIFLTMLTASLSSQETVSAGSRKMSEEAQQELKKRKGSEENEEAEVEEAGYAINAYPPIYYSDDYHFLKSIIVYEKNQYKIELSDGSIWKLSGYEGEKIAYWKESDPLIISQNSRWFSRHDYQIINKKTGSSVAVTLDLVYPNERSKIVTGIDPINCCLTLSDHSVWKISYLDAVLFEDWALGDYVIMGTNNRASFWDSESDALIINVNLNSSCRAQEI